MLDPETNFLQAVRYFLEPLNDGSLPAYNIQRDIFNALVKLPIQKDSLLSSGIGRVVFYYTKSKKPVPEIKRMAERLVGEWSRPVLKRTDDYKKRHIETRDFDIAYVLKMLNVGALRDYTNVCLFTVLRRKPRQLRPLSAALSSPSLNAQPARLVSRLSVSARLPQRSKATAP